MNSAIALAAGSILVPAVIAVVIGLILALWGWTARRRSALVAATPQVPVQSIGTGTVHVYGKTTGDQRLLSPITGVPCYYYSVLVEKWVKQGDQERWEKFKEETGYRNFYIEDATGRVLVDVQRVDFDVPDTLRAEIGPKSSHYCKVDPSLGIPRLSENQLHASLVADWGQVRAAAQNLSAAAGVAGSGVVKTADKVLAAGEKMAEWGVAMNVDGVSINPGMMGESFRFRETCLLADREYSVIGTCDPNPNAKNDTDKKIIHKGQGQKIFLVSLKTGEQLVERLRLRGTVLITIGTVMALGGLVLAIVKR